MFEATKWWRLPVLLGGAAMHRVMPLRELEGLQARALVTQQERRLNQLCADWMHARVEATCSPDEVQSLRTCCEALATY